MRSKIEYRRGIIDYIPETAMQIPSRADKNIAIPYLE